MCRAVCQSVVGLRKLSPWHFAYCFFSHSLFFVFSLSLSLRISGLCNSWHSQVQGGQRVCSDDLLLMHVSARTPGRPGDGAKEKLGAALSCGDP